MKEEITQEGIVEVDEMGYGGKRRRWLGKEKTEPLDVIAGSLERGGKLKLGVVKGTNRKSLSKFFGHIAPGSELFTERIAGPAVPVGILQSCPWDAGGGPAWRMDDRGRRHCPPASSVAQSHRFAVI